MTRIAVFARNYPQYLVHACEIGEDDPTQLVTFRSARVWARIKKGLAEQEMAKVYFAPVGGDALVSYTATLHSLVLNPKRGEPQTDAALTFQLPETINEALWAENEGAVRTLYLVANCKRVARPFDLSTLRKASDGKPLSNSYGYSYVPVLESLNVHEGRAFNHPEEVVDPQLYTEGAVRRVAVNAFERDPNARGACVAHFGPRCAVCLMDFGETYGELGAGFIHVHHLKPLSSVGKQYTVDPLEDLRPVCPNCHAMLHRRDPPLGVGELRELMQRLIANKELHPTGSAGG